jgi:hypothetical protein
VGLYSEGPEELRRSRSRAALQMGLALRHQLTILQRSVKRAKLRYISATMHLQMNITVRGDGVAAHCCARLLEAEGLHVTLQRPPRPKLPAIMIGATTQKLFVDVFGQSDLFREFPVINRRVVAWGPGSDPRVLPHSAVIASEQDLLDRLQTQSGAPCDAGPAGWTIVASRPLPELCDEQHFGSRTARAAPVRLREGADRSACWVESLENGWLFLMPDGQEAGWLLAVGDFDGFEFGESRLMNYQVAEIAGAHSEFRADPRISWPLCGHGWLACGAGALAFDPLCGDGSGHAIREAILAAAVVRAVQLGEDQEELLAHYRSRLLAGFKRHLEVCEEFYRTGGSTSWWQAQLEAVRTGLSWCARELTSGPGTQYQLRGFDLHRVRMQQS